MADDDFERRVEAARRFNRFYTKRIGVLEEGLLRSPFSLTEARVIYELAHHEGPTATDLAGELSLDPGYLSRVLRRLEDRGVLCRTLSPDDARQYHIALTEEGREAFAALDAASREEIGAMLRSLPDAEQERLVEAMVEIQELLGDESGPAAPYLLRPPRPGDMGWVVHRHGVLYAEEYGWNEEFEALVAEIVAGFMNGFDPDRECCWIAEMDGENVGCVFLVQGSEAIARLRLLLVEPKARGFGIGSRLVEECVRSARLMGYAKITLWTNDVLHAARRIYERAGFRLVEEEPHHSFGRDLVGQTWELELEEGR